MSRRLFAVALVLAVPSAATAVGAGLGACAAFDDIVLPTDASVADVLDAPDDAPLDSGEGGLGPSYLTTSQAAHLCGLLLDCPTNVAEGYLLSSQMPAIAFEPNKGAFSLCMHWLTEVLHAGHIGFEKQRALQQTLAGATDCAGLQALLPIEQLDASPCGTAGTVCSLDQAKIVRCSDAGLFVEHCRAPFYPEGGTCTTVAGSPTCLVDGCPAPQCAGGIFGLCIVNKSVVFDCSLVHRDCTSTPSPQCATGATCGGSGLSCQGANIAACVLGSSIVFECPPASICSSFSPSAFFCAKAGATCTPGTVTDRCDGTQIVYCGGGIESRVDCARVQSGWTCKNTPSVHCAP